MRATDRQWVEAIDRRAELIRQLFRVGLTEEEQADLDELEAFVDRHIDEVAPLGYREMPRAEGQA